jgi:hypothetical protein
MYGEYAYWKYCEATDGRSLVSGDLLPEWSALDEGIQDAWQFAAHSVLVEFGSLGSA